MVIIHYSLLNFIILLFVFVIYIALKNKLYTCILYVLHYIFIEFVYDYCNIILILRNVNSLILLSTYNDNVSQKIIL